MPNPYICPKCGDNVSKVPQTSHYDMFVCENFKCDYSLVEPIPNEA